MLSQTPQSTTHSAPHSGPAVHSTWTQESVIQSKRATTGKVNIPSSGCIAGSPPPYVPDHRHTRIHPPRHACNRHHSYLSRVGHDRRGRTPPGGAEIGQIRIDGDTPKPHRLESDTAQPLGRPTIQYASSPAWSGPVTVRIVESRRSSTGDTAVHARRKVARQRVPRTPQPSVLTGRSSAAAGGYGLSEAVVVGQWRMGVSHHPVRVRGVMIMRHRPASDELRDLCVRRVIGRRRDVRAS